MTTRPSRAFRRLAIVTAALTYLLIVVGGVVRVTGSGDGCGSSGGWPLCNGSLLPALRTTTLIEFSHRWITTIATVLIVALVITAWARVRRHRRLVVASTLAGVLLVVQIALGALVVEFDLPGGIVLVHLANALLLLAVLVYVAVTANTLGTAAESRASDLARAVRPTTIAAGATYLLALSGALVVETKSSAGCNGWPLCGGGFQLPAAQMDVINMTHRVVAGVAVVLIGVVMGVLLRRFRGDRALRRAAMVVNVVLLAQIAAGALVVVLRLPSGVQALHLALASLLWASVVGVAVLTRARLEATEPAPAENEPGVRLPRTAHVASA
ncbi:MAG: COX15/CtaA family protein [Candidatus Dormibacteria bacterium]